MNKMIVFLGNPGNQYEKTRHNAGRLFCSFLNPAGPWQTKFHGEFFKEGEVVWLRPSTYMNESGLSVRECSDFFGIPADRILAVHDDIELGFGRVILRAGGGTGGHNGLRSLKQHLGTDGFVRLRIGVGRPEGPMDVASFVLSRFSEKEETELPAVFSLAREQLRTFIGV